jgi:hypothetical protein
MLTASQWLLLAGWAVIVPLFIGWGILVRRLWRAPLRADGADFLLSFWIGWAAVILVLQLWHFALPVDGRARLLVAAGGVFGLISAWRAGGRLLSRAHRALPVLVAAVPIAVWLANRASEGSRFGDTGGYYVPTIRWMIEYPVVIGLANLYPPYAYNQTYFLYAALLDGGAFAGRAHHVLNSALLAVLIARTLLGLWRVLRRRGMPGAADVFYALMLPAETEAAVGYLLTSPAPDFAVYVLGIALCGELIAVLARPSAAPASTGDVRLHFLTLMLLAALAPTIKLSASGLAAAAMLVGAAAWIVRTRGQWRSAVADLALASAALVITIIPWAVANVLMSGCPFFPSAIAALPVRWRVDWDVQQWIQNTMNIGDWRVAVRAPNWVAQRFVALGWTAAAVAVPLAVAVVALAAGAIMRLVRLATRRPRPTAGVRISAAALLPPLAALVFCIATTPVPRYAGATMWLLAACSAMAALGTRLLAPRARRVIALCAVALAALPFFTGAALWLDLRGFPPSPRPPVEQQRLRSGLDVHVPARGGHSCWAATLPCTPRLHPGLRLRRPPALGSGFEVDPRADGGAAASRS